MSPVSSTISQLRVFVAKMKAQGNSSFPFPSNEYLLASSELLNKIWFPALNIRGGILTTIELVCALCRTRQLLV